MKLQRLHVKNFQSLGDIVFDFPAGLVLIDGWNEDLQSHNGVGKSALLNAITYAVYGKLPKAVNVGELVRQGTKFMSVEIDLESKGKTIKIQRTRGKSGKVTLLVDSKEVPGLAKDIDTQIPELIGLTFEQFVQVIYIFQNADRRFISLNDTEKKKFLSTILNLDVYDNAYKIAHARLTALELETSKFVGQLESTERNMPNLLDNLKSAQTATTDFETEKTATVARLSNGVRTTKAAIKELEAQKALVQNSTALSELQAKKSGIVELFNKNTQNKKEIAAIDMQIQYLQKDINKEIKLRDKPESAKCNECGQSIPGWSLEEHQKRAQDNIDALEENIKKCLNAKSQIKVTSEETLDKMLQKVMEDIASEKAKGPERFDPLIAAQKSELKTYAAEVQMLDQKFQSLKRDVEKAVRSIEVARGELERVKGLLKGTEDQKGYLLETKKIFSPTGIRAYVFDGIIKELNDRVAWYLEALSGGAIRFAFDSDDSKGKFLETCEYMGTPRSIAALSGGEYRRLSLAVDMALADVVCNRISVYPNVLFLDEAFEGLDAVGRETVMALLTDLVEQKEAIYVVDHATELKTAFGQVFEMTKKNGETRTDDATESQQTDSQLAAQAG